MVVKEKTPPSPNELGFKYIETYSFDHTKQEGFADIKALRNVDGNGYRVFCVNFLQCMVQDKEWRQKPTRIPISDWIGAGLEAFAVLAYVNGYNSWMKTFGKNLPGDEDELSSILTKGT